MDLYISKSCPHCRQLLILFHENKHLIPYFNIMEYKNGSYTLSKKIGNKKITARQNAPKTFEHVAGLYYFKKNYILKCKNLFQGKIFGYNVSLFKSFDIDSLLDFKLVELILKLFNIIFTSAKDALILLSSSIREKLPK